MYYMLKGLKRNNITKKHSIEENGRVKGFLNTRKFLEANVCIRIGDIQTVDEVIIITFSNAKQP